MIYRGFFKLYRLKLCEKTTTKFPSLQKNKLWALVCLCILTVSILRADSVSGQTVARVASLEELQKGENLMSMAFWPEALMAFDNAITLDPTFADAYMKKASLLAKIGRTIEAEQLYAKAVQLNPYSAYIYDSRAKSRMLAQNYKGALADLQVAVGLNGDDPDLRDDLIDDLILNGNYEDALKEIDSLLMKDFRVGYELEKKALILLLEGEIEQAIRVVDNVISLNPGSAFAHDLLGLGLLLSNRPSDAHAAFSRALELDSTMVNAYHNRAIANRILGNSQEALNDLNKGLELSQNSHRLLYARAVIRTELGLVDRALEDYNAAILMNNEFEDALYNRAYTLKLIGRLTEALDDLEKVLGSNPDQAEAWNLKGNVKVLNAQYDRAIGHYDKAIELDPYHAKAYYNRGLAKLMSYRFTDGCEDLRSSSGLGLELAEKKLRAFCAQ